jgi:hypothetical protein
VVVVGTGVVAGAVVGAWTAGSDFSPHPAVARAATAAAPSASGRSRRFMLLLTPGTVTNRVGLVVAWAIVTLPVAIALALAPGQAILLIACHGPISDGA